MKPKGFIAFAGKGRTEKPVPTGEGLWSDRNMKIAVFLMYIAAVLIRGFILPGPHIMYTYYDELLYWGLAKTFWRNPVFTIYQMPVDFSKFIYPMVLSPLYLIGDAVVRTQVAGWLNTLWINFSIFPAYRIAKKITPSKKIQLASLALFMTSPILLFGEKYVPECLYLPLSLYLMVGAFTLLERVKAEDGPELKRLCGEAALLGAFGYLIYLEREAVTAFVAGLTICLAVHAIRKLARHEEDWKRPLAAAAAHGGAFLLLYFVVGRILGLSFSYSAQVGLANINTMFKVEYFIHCLISNGLYITVAFFGLPILIPQLRANRAGEAREEGGTRRQWVIFFLISFMLTLVFLSFGISVKEELGNESIRLHTRYFMPFLFPMLLLGLEEIRRFPGGLRAKATLVLCAGAACFLLLQPMRFVSDYDSADTWHVRNTILASEEIGDDLDPEEESPELTDRLSAFFADETDGSAQISFNHGLKFLMLVFTGWMVLMVFLTGKNKAAAYALFAVTVLAVQGYNNYASIDRYSRFCLIPEEDAEAYAWLDEAVRDAVDDEPILVVSTEKFETAKMRLETFMSFDWYSMLTNGLASVLGENGEIDLTQTRLPISMTQFVKDTRYPEGTEISYILCRDDIRWNEDSVELVFHSDRTGYSLYENLDPELLDVDYINGLYNENGEEGAEEAEDEEDEEDEEEDEEDEEEDEEA